MSESRRIPLSVLDTAPVFEGSTPTQALRGSLALAPEVERLGYTRYWFAEHHNTPSLATSSPAVLIGRVASLTSTLRVGSGGVMLPNHPPLVVAEQFGTLEAMHPGRIDLGIGRAPGTDPVTARALRRDAAFDFPQQIAELVEYFTSSGPGRPASGIAAIPAQENQPPIWMLGSSPNSARFAGVLGLPFAFAFHFSPHAAEAALAAYRDAFRPSAHVDRPHAILAGFGIVAESDDEAEWLAGPVKLFTARGRQNPHGLFPRPEEAAAYTYSSAENALIRELFGPQLIGSPETVRKQTVELLARTGADELMIATSVHDHTARVRSYQLLAETLAPEGIGGGPQTDAEAQISEV
ncbi:LLM class flavin-dependent oxidoreductase [Streptomyces scopuliridis]|uniref:LLM class flavin-dependent oxidoreductase n=1 Tax=Streptomyces scopuliridis TaxID=452529 RepID=UPI0034293A5F